jgi:hypothetical protein
MNRRFSINLAIVLLATSVVGCEQQPPPDRQKDASQKLEPDRLRAALVDGLEAATRDPATASQLGFHEQLADHQVEAAFERLLARATADPVLERIADGFFVTLQAKPAMREALIEHARQNPEFVDSDLGALRETFIASVEARLTRDEVAKLLSMQWHMVLVRSDQALAKAWAKEAGGASALADRVVAKLDREEVRVMVSAFVGSDNPQLALAKRFVEPSYGTRLLRDLSTMTQLGRTSKVPLAPEVLVEILDHERTATLLAGSLARMLSEEPVRQRCEALFALALAAEFDASAFEQELAQLLEEPAVAREAAAFLSAVASEEFARNAVAKEIEQWASHHLFEMAVAGSLG